MSQLVRVCEQLQNEWSRLQCQWQRTADEWNDAVRGRFERDFWQPYEPTVLAMQKELDRLDHVIGQAQREVK